MQPNGHLYKPLLTRNLQLGYNVFAAVSFALGLYMFRKKSPREREANYKVR